MRGLTVERTVKVTCNRNGDDWGLYTNRDNAARQLNRRFEELVNDGHDSLGVREGMWSLMRTLGDDGADDGEAHDVLDRLLAEVFG